MAGFAEWSNKKYAAAQQAQTQTQTQTQETAGGFAAWSNRKYAAQAQKPENLPQDAGNAFGMATAYPDAQSKIRRETGAGAENFDAGRGKRFRRGSCCLPECGKRAGNKK